MQHWQQELSSKNNASLTAASEKVLDGIAYIQIADADETVSLDFLKAALHCCKVATSELCVSVKVNTSEIFTFEEDIIFSAVTFHAANELVLGETEALCVSL